jgi:REP element-mobilizing transposase RayT
VLVTLRLLRSVPNMRSQRCMRVVWRAFAAAKDRLGLRLVHYAVQPDHLHLLVEPDEKRALSRGVQGLCIRLAKRLNAMLGRRGHVFGDRFHARPLPSPRQVRNALAYTLLQQRRHAAKRGQPLVIARDGCSSAPLFEGWSVEATARDGPWTGTVVPARTWMLASGWIHHGLIDPAEVPGAPRSRRS